MFTLTCLMVIATSGLPSRCACGSPAFVHGTALWCAGCGPVALAAKWQSDSHPRDKNGRFGSGGGHAQALQVPAGVPQREHRWISISSGDQDGAVQNALGALAGVDGVDGTNITVAHTAPPPPGPGQVSTAWTDPADGGIYVNDQSRAYKQAVKGDVTELAGALAHEQYHRLHGADEESAYDHQLAVLRQLGAKKSLIADIENSRKNYRR